MSNQNLARVYEPELKIAAKCCLKASPIGSMRVRREGPLLAGVHINHLSGAGP